MKSSSVPAINIAPKPATQPTSTAAPIKQVFIDFGVSLSYSWQYHSNQPRRHRARKSASPRDCNRCDSQSVSGFVSWLSGPGCCCCCTDQANMSKVWYFNAMKFQFTTSASQNASLASTASLPTLRKNYKRNDFIILFRPGSNANMD